MGLDNIIEEMGLTDKYRIFEQQQNILLKGIWNILHDNPYVRPQNNFSKFKKTQNLTERNERRPK